MAALSSGEKELITAFLIRLGRCARASRVATPPQEKDITTSARKCSISPSSSSASYSLVMNSLHGLCGLERPAYG
ncbi:hypothetical protein D3C80_1839790 [compost metagenome]